VIHHHDRAAAQRLAESAATEVVRLERVLSLYRTDSALAELNRHGALVAPPADLVTLLELSADVWEACGGIFDPTIQPLWMLYAGHFSKPGADPAGPTSKELQKALKLVGLDRVRFNGDRIVFTSPGMALTFNGIAQGYIADRVVDLLRSGNIAKSLVDMGEIRALGSRPDDTPWRVAIKGSSDMAAQTLEIVDRAVATSSADGFCFDQAGRFNHLLDPRSGCVARRQRRVTVVAFDAAPADAFSTAFSLMEPDEIARVVGHRPGLQVHLDDEGDIVRL